MNIASLLTAAALVAAGVSSAGAQSTDSAGRSASPSMVPYAAFFAGLGGSFNSTEFGKQNLYAQGVSVISQAGVPVAFGSAGGPMTPNFDTASTFAPTAQFGYFRHFSESQWLWGAKFSYSYLNAGSTEDNVVVPQVGSFTSSTPDTFTGNVVVRSYETSIRHQLSFMPFVGRSFERSFIYLGAGPSLSQLESDLDGMIGFAAINGTHVNITGEPSSFSSDPWVFGGSAVIGATYFLNPSWFMDLNYSFAITDVYTSEFSAPFSSSTDGYDDVGIISGDYSGRVITQSLRFSINKAF